MNSNNTEMCTFHHEITVNNNIIDNLEFLKQPG